MVQATWLELVGHLDRLRNPDSVGAWLGQVVKHEAVRRSKRQRRLQLGDARLDVATGDQFEGVFRAADVAKVRAALERIDERCRRLLRLLFNERDLEYREIAKILDMPIGSIGPTRERCLARVRRLFGEGER